MLRRALADGNLRLARPLASLALVLLSCAAALAGAEWAARRLDAGPPWYERLLAEQVEAPGPLQGRYGMRAQDLRTLPMKGRTQLMVLGDSFTFGSGVMDAGAAFPGLLAKEMKGVDVLNAGVPGSLTKDWVELWKVLRLRGYRPDAVLVVFFLRDGTRASFIPGLFGPIRNDIAKRDRRSRLYRLSALYRLLRDGLDRRAIGREYTERFRRAYLGDEKETEEWRNAQQQLLLLRDAASKDGARVGLAVFPVLISLDERYPFEEVHRAVAGFAREHGLPVLDLLPSFRGRDAARLWVSPYNQHPNEEGHRIAAKALLPFARELLRARE